jgi:hypothetical protein
LTELYCPDYVHRRLSLARRFIGHQCTAA